MKTIVFASAALLLASGAAFADQSFTPDPVNSDAVTSTYSYTGSNLDRTYTSSIGTYDRDLGNNNGFVPSSRSDQGDH